MGRAAVVIATTTGAAAIAVATLQTGVVGAAAPDHAPLRMVAVASNLTDESNRSGAPMEVRIDRWTTVAERNQLIAAFADHGQDGLVRALKQSERKGQMRIPTWRGLDPHEYRIGWALRYAWHIAEPDGGMRIVLATDRHLGFGEERRHPGTEEFPVSFIEFRLNREGEGEGRIAAAGRLSIDRATGKLELEDYSSEPALLQNVRVER
jgi:hypothetical protein